MLERGVALRGLLWTGGDAAPIDDGVVVVGTDGRVAAAGPADEIGLPADLAVLSGGWVGPGIVDTHVHLTFAGPAPADVELGLGVVAVRDLGATLECARAWRRDTPTVVAVTGPLVTAPGGYPGRTWGAGGIALEVAGVAGADRAVHLLTEAGADLVKVTVGDPGAEPCLAPRTLTALVRAAHDAGLAVTAHALTGPAVAAALDAGVDELAHVPTGALDRATVERVAAAGITVISTLQCHAGIGDTRANAAALHAAGVPLLYGTDLGNDGTRPGVDPRELDRLAEAGLGRPGALRAATDRAATAAGLAGRAPAGLVRVGHPAAVVLLPADPLVEPAAWRAPLAVVCGGQVVRPAGRTPAAGTARMTAC